MGIPKFPSLTLQVIPDFDLSIGSSEVAEITSKICKIIKEELSEELEWYSQNEVYILPVSLQEHLFAILLSVLVDYMIQWGYFTNNQKNSLLGQKNNDLK